MKMYRENEFMIIVIHYEVRLSSEFERLLSNDTRRSNCDMLK